MPIRPLTYQQSVFKRYFSNQHFSEFYLQDGGKYTERNYVTVTVTICIVLSADFFRNGVWQA